MDSYAEAIPWVFKSFPVVTLVRWLSWLGHCPIHQKAVSSIPSQGTCLSCRFDHCYGAYRRQPNDPSLLHWCFSISVFLSKINRHILRGGLKKSFSVIKLRVESVLKIKQIFANIPFDKVLIPEVYKVFLQLITKIQMQF